MTKTKKNIKIANAIYMDGQIFVHGDIEKMENIDAVSALVDLGAETYDMTFENSGDRMVVYKLNLETGKEEVFDNFAKTIEADKNDITSLCRNIKHWIATTFVNL